MAAAQKLTKFKLYSKDFIWNSPGIRAQLFDTKKGSLEMDFVNIKKSNQYHILNSISPAWTCFLKQLNVMNQIEKII